MASCASSRNTGAASDDCSRSATLNSRVSVPCPAADTIMCSLLPMMVSLTVKASLSMM